MAHFHASLGMDVEKRQNIVVVLMALPLMRWCLVDCSAAAPDIVCCSLSVLDLAICILCYRSFVYVCFCRVRFSFFSTTPRDWLGRTSPKWPILCRVGRKTLTQSATHSKVVVTWWNEFHPLITALSVLRNQFSDWLPSPSLLWIWLLTLSCSVECVASNLCYIAPSW